MSRLNWVPLHAVMVAREGGLVDAYAATNGGKKAFPFTAEEVKELQALEESEGQPILRAPVDEDSVSQADVEKAAEPTPDPLKVAAAVEAAAKVTKAVTGVAAKKVAAGAAPKVVAPAPDPDGEL